MKKITIELVAGLFVITGIICLTYVAVSIGGASFSDKPSFTLNARFISVAGLREGAVIEGAGVRIGTVSSIEFDPDSFEAIVGLTIDEGIPIQEDAIAAIRTQGIIGEKYIKITPGGFDELLTDGMELYETESSISLEELVSKYIFSSDG